MSGTLDNIRDEVNEAVDDAAREVDDAINDVDDNNDSSTNTAGGSGTPGSATTAVSGSTTSREAQMTRLYDTVLDRPPDEAGLRFWTTSLRLGTDLDDVAELFVRSPEFRDRYGDVGQAEFVNLLYRNVLDREADPAGQTFWTDALASGRADRNDVVLAFSESPEHVAKVGPVPNLDPLL